MAILSDPPQGDKPYDDDFYLSRFNTQPIDNPQPWQMGDYTMQYCLAKTSSAAVWRATHPMHGDVAVKFVTAAMRAREAATDKRLTNEFLILAALHHQHIARTVGHGRHNDMQWLAMEYIHGGTLTALMARHPHADAFAGKRPLRAYWAADYGQQVARALAYAHSQGIIHRDVKSSNIILREELSHHVVLADFGIAIMTAGDRVTLDGKAIGTPDYMSPEQCKGEDLDGRSDIYSLGVVLYELLTGDIPFKHPLPMRVCYMHVNTPPPPLPNYVHPHLAQVVLKAMNKDREQRYQSGLDLAKALMPFVEAH